jgi:hypothetical protein
VRRFLNLGALASLAVMVFIGFLFEFTGGGFSPRHLTLLPHCYLCADDDHLCLFLYNDAQYGPYRGSIIAMESPGHPSGIVEHSFGTRAGIYYRHFHFPNGYVLWTFAISIFYPLGIAMAFPIAWLCVNFRHNKSETRGFPVSRTGGDNL